MSFLPARSSPLRALVPAALLAAACGCDAGVPESRSREPARAAVLEPFLEVEVDERWRGISAYNVRDEGGDAAREGQVDDGYRTLWHPNGVKKGEGLFEDGRRQGPWTWWYESGQKRWEGSYVDDRPEGQERSWFENGQLEYEGTFRAEQRDGPWRRWYDNGTLAVRGHYREGKREGEFRYWSYEGELDRERSGLYADDVRVGDLPD